MHVKTNVTFNWVLELFSILNSRYFSSQGSNHDILRPSTATSQSRSAFRGISPTSFKPPSNIGSYYEPSIRAQVPGKPGSVASQNPYTSVSMPSSPARHTSNYDSRASSSSGYEKLNSQRGAGYESLAGSYDKKPSIAGSSKLNPVFDESLSTAVSIPSGSTYGSK